MRNDLEFNYLIKVNPQLNQWRSLAVEWFKDQKRSRAVRQQALNRFLLDYIHDLELEMNPYSFLHKSYASPSFWNILGYKSNTAVALNNYIVEFLDWVLQEKLSIEDDFGTRIIPNEYRNSITKRLREGSLNNGETFRSPLPFRYIRELRSMLCQGPNFSDWKWAHSAVDQDWFEVDCSIVDETDADCLWRKRTVPMYNYDRRIIGYREIFEIWSPVRAVALYVKLMLPLRTHQVRMLDSGEADTWRYVRGRWVLNSGHLATGSEKRPYMRGVFHRTMENGKPMTGFFINTNKTADINKHEKDKGYVIPWQMEELLSVLEKLRDWQSKYNPLSHPTNWVDLKPKHDEGLTHKNILGLRGTACFLFRMAAARYAEDRILPMCDNLLDTIWYKLLLELETRCKARGETIDDDSKIRLVYDKPDAREGKDFTTTHYPLHSLRVSLITAFALEGGVPFPILSKLIAGHSRLLMTLYYTKAGKAHVTEVMSEAEKALLETDKESYRRFLQNATYEQLEARFAANDPAAFWAVSQQKTFSSVVFEDKGICPMGCGACDIGGDAMRKTSNNKTLYAPVAGYPAEKNCVRCRFFLSGPAFLPGLIAHFNNISYQLTECSNRYVMFMDQVEKLEELRFTHEARGLPFTAKQELEKTSKFCEQEAQKADKFIYDLRATLRLIDRCIEILKSPQAVGVKLVPVGTISDIQYALKEIGSEMHQLEVICENAVLYVEADASKAILRRSQILDTMLRINGKSPLLLTLRPEQQLYVGNHLMQIIKDRVGNLPAAVEVAEGKVLLSEIGILDTVCDLIESESRVHVVSMNTITIDTASPVRQIENKGGGDVYDAGRTT